ncbi:MAG: DUF445 domain-containing protein [Rhodanobacteraceae bacterium]
MDTTLDNSRPASGAKAEKRAALRRRKRWAVALLGVAAAAFCATAVLDREHGFGVVGLVRAMAEAALVGGLADWYAVVALFRHPLGLPLPHTAIIPRKKQAIGHSLADFIREHFLRPQYIAERVRAIDPADRLAAYMSTPESAEQLADVSIEVASHLVDVLDNKDLQHFVWRTARMKLADMDAPGLLAQVLDLLTRDGRHREAVDSLLADVAGYVQRPDVRAMLSARIADELWAIMRWVKLDKVVADKVADKVSAATAQLIEEMANDIDHPLRRRFDRQLPLFIDRLRTDADLRGKVDAFRDAVIANRELADYTGELYRSTLAWIRRDLADPASRIHHRVVDATQAMGRHLKATASLDAWFNAWLATTTATLIDRYGDNISAYIEARVDAWTTAEVTEELELSIGGDLQWIRYNGTAVGALIGVLLYGLAWAIHLVAS